MAEPTNAPASPALPSTADADPYVPIAWSAVAAVAVAGVFAVSMLALGVSAFVNKKPLISIGLLVPPVIAMVLSFAARRIIRNSEGTRTGEGLANGAWWTALVVGLGYAAYLFAIDFAIDREASAEAERWVGLVRDDKVVPAFYQTIPPGARQGVARTDEALIRQRFRDELLAFAGSDLLRLAARNRGPGEFTFADGRVTNTVHNTGSIDCTFAGVVTCPEGRFPVAIGLRGSEGVSAEGGGGGGRQWMVVRPQGGGFIDQAKAARTTYGWMLGALEVFGAGHARLFVEHATAGGPSGHPYLLRAFVLDEPEPAEWAAVARSPVLQAAFAVPFGVARPGALAAAPPDGFFKLPGGADPTPGQRDRFLAAWNAQGVFEAGRRLKAPGGDAPDKENTLRVLDGGVEVSVPIEVPLPGVGKMETARGRLVVVCRDPGLLSELRERKAAAAGETPAANPPPDVEQWARAAWRVVRIESDLAPVNLAPAAAGPGGPGG